MRPALDVGLLGCGGIALSVHLRVLASLPSVRLAALAEPDPARRAQAGRAAPGASLFENYRALLAAAPVEAVIVCLPTDMHAEAATAAFEAGKHVYLEKPLASTCEEAGRVLAAWRRSGRVGTIGFNYRFHPLVQALRRDLRAGRVGQAVGAQTVFATAGRGTDGWRSARRTGGGVLLDLASHHVDLLRYLFDDEVAEVFARVRSVQSEHDRAILELRLASGLDVQVFSAYGAIEEDSLAVFGPGGKLWIDRYRGLQVEYLGPQARFTRLRRLAGPLRSLAGLPYWLRKSRSPRHEPSYLAALAHFAQAVRSGTPACPDLLDGYRSLAVVEAAEESSRTGRAVAPRADEQVEAAVIANG